MNTFTTKIILFFILISGSFIAKGQNSNFSIEVQYPVSIYNSLNNSHVGIIGGALQYQFGNNEIYNFGIEYRLDIKRTTKSNFYLDKDLKYTDGNNSLNIFSKISIPSTPIKIYLEGGVGTLATANNRMFAKNFGGGINVVLSERLYLSVNYVNYLIDSGKSQQFGRLGLGFKI